MSTVELYLTPKPFSQPLGELMEGMELVYTIGYGGRSLEELLELLERSGVVRVVDVRRWVKSVRRPELAGENLARVLAGRGLDYVWLPELGGYRRFGVDVEDLGLARCFESEGFRAYATYITTRREVKQHLARLERLVSEKRSALLCRERVPWACHRKILSDYLVARGFKVLHILDAERAVEHKLSSCAVVEGGELKYL